ncbi:helix-turn-helix domain-containing protein [Sphingomonas sp. RHCKR47]|uniref:helix-turn-helix domain-containing protein n=1 Tax=Sphingomonas citricola TaxID=2862498 RepID=UPI001C6724A4|nr:helix-turn-helix domain-containing protein [Sphingomonas citricola]MBW6524680.1 helix-turn-helix domain-containing protein [Sphingomonas citricola]
MRAEDLRGGTNRPGVPETAFRMPPGLALRYDLPAADLHELVSGYATYAATARDEMVNWFLPAPPMICVLLDAGPVGIAIRNHRFTPAPVSLYGATSNAFRATTTGGVQVGIGLTALGWVRMFARPAGTFHNRVVPLDQVLHPDVAQQMLSALEAVGDERAIAPTLDAILAPMFMHRHPHEEAIRGFTELMLVDGVIEIGDAAERLGLPTTTLRRLAIYAFGMPPKILLRRARFLRSFVSLLRAGEPMAYHLIDSSYYDASHFLRDANTFLGTTPRRFIAQGTTFMAASMVARAAAIGPATQALHAHPR